MGLKPVADEEPTAGVAGVALSEDAVPFFTQDPLLERRRVQLSSLDIMNLLQESLIRRGMPADKLQKTRWVWVADKNGGPILYLIFPGPEA